MSKVGGGWGRNLEFIWAVVGPCRWEKGVFSRKNWKERGVEEGGVGPDAGESREVPELPPDRIPDLPDRSARGDTRIPLFG